MTVTRRTNEHIFALIENEVLPELKTVKGDVADVKQTLKRAGLDNGHAPEVKAFFDRRSKRQAALEYLGDVLQPIARFKALAYLVGVVASAGWAVMAVVNVLNLLNPHH